MQKIFPSLTFDSTETLPHVEFMSADITARARQTQNTRMRGLHASPRANDMIWLVLGQIWSGGIFPVMPWEFCSYFTKLLLYDREAMPVIYNYVYVALG